jgi:hypothetical protein
MLWKFERIDKKNKPGSSVLSCHEFWGGVEMGEEEEEYVEICV